MNGETQFLSRSQFAASQNWSPSYVTKLGQQGRLVLGPDGKLVDVSATLAVLKKTSDPGKEAVREHHAAGRVDRGVTSEIKPDAKDTQDSGSSDPEYWKNKARREGALAELAELELLRKRGDLVERQRVEAAAFASSRMLRDAILGLPTQLAPELATMADAFQVEVKLRDALRQVLADAAKMTADDLAKIMGASH